MEIFHVVVYALIALCSVFLVLLKYRLSYWKKRGVIYDEPSVIGGNMGRVGRTQHLREPFREFYRKYKGIASFGGFYLFFRPAAVILDLELVKCILIKDFQYFSDRGNYYNEHDDPLSGHLFNLDGPKWRLLRAKLSPTFTSGKMKFMFPCVVDVAVTFVEILGNMLTSSTGSAVVEITELLARFTTDVIGSCAFGLECNSLKDPNAKFRMMGKKAFSDRRHSRAVVAFFQAFPDLSRRLHLKINPDDVSDFFMSVVKDTVEYREVNNIKRNDFMNLLIDLKNQTGTDSLTVEEIAAQAFVFFLAGFETSSSMMGFLLYELAIHQNIQDKARSEIQNILQKYDGVFTFESMREMKYLNQIIYETLRVYSIATILVRRSTKDYPVPNTKKVIEKGTVVVIPVDAIHHDPDIYPNPEHFDPDRFSPEEIVKRSSVAWLPFGDGPRNCIGLRFGEMQARIGLAILLKNFKFSPSEETKIPLEFDKKNFMLASEGGIFLKIEKLF